MGLLEGLYTLGLPDLLMGAGLLLVTGFCATIVQGYHVRKTYKDLQKQGIPIMEHSWILGHLKVMGEIMEGLPPDAHSNYLMVRIQENWRKLFPNCTKCPPVIYIDTWPITPRMVLSINSDVSHQFTTEYSLPKARQQKEILYPLTKNLDVASMEGAEWKLWRKRLNAGFSIQYITSRFPDIIEETEDFVNLLERKVGKDGSWGDVFKLGEAMTNLTLDVILRFFLNTRFHEQKQRSETSKALLDILSRLYFFVNVTNFLGYYNPLRQFKLWNGYRILTKQLSPFIQERVAQAQSIDGPAPSKSLVDLIVARLEEERAENMRIGAGVGAGYDKPLVLDKSFTDMAIGQLNTFLFAGHDTTAATICWFFHVLEQYPEAAARVRQEHDSVLGPDPERAADLLRKNPSLLNNLTYTTAVIKESMRVHTNVGSMRRGEPGFYLRGPPGSAEYEGKLMPTEGFLVWDGTFATQRDPDTWHRPTEFLPERWLITDETDPLHPPNNGFRSFSHGPRVCMGQHLAMVEIKLVAALVVRRFDIKSAWDEWDVITKRDTSKKPYTVFGDRCYQVGNDSPPHVKDEMPVHVRLRSH